GRTQGQDKGRPHQFFRASSSNFLREARLARISASPLMSMVSVLVMIASTKKAPAFAPAPLTSLSRNRGVENAIDANLLHRLDQLELAEPRPVHRRPGPDLRRLDQRPRPVQNLLALADGERQGSVDVSQVRAGEIGHGLGGQPLQDDAPVYN